MSMLELKVPPLVVFLLTGALMWALARWVPHADVSVPGGVIVASLLVLAGVALAVSAIRRFRQHDTTVHPTKPEEASTIVTTGIYRFTRNPMYLALALVLTAWGIKLGNASSLACVPLFIAYMTRFQIKPEERTLRSLFGAPYNEYLNTVRRWL